MKKIITSLLVLVSVLACTKQNHDIEYGLESQNNDEIQTYSPDNFNLKSNSERTTYHDNGGDDFGCDGPPDDCLAEVTVSGSSISTLEILLWMLLWSLLESQHQIPIDVENPYQDINEAFTIDYDAFCGILSPEVVDGVLDDTYTISTKCDGFEDNKIGYIIFKNSIDEIVEVYPNRFTHFYD